MTKPKCTRYIGDKGCLNDMTDLRGRCDFHREMETGSRANPEPIPPHKLEDKETK